MKIKKTLSNAHGVSYDISFIQKEENVLKKAEEGDFEAILISYDLPGDNGLEILLEIGFLHEGAGREPVHKLTCCNISPRLVYITLIFALIIDNRFIEPTPKVFHLPHIMMLHTHMGDPLPGMIVQFLYIGVVDGPALSNGGATL